MTLEAKRKAITNFVVGIDRYRDDVKADALDMVKAVPIEILDNADLVEEFLVELMEAIARKHVITEDGKIRPRVAAMIRSYVRGMKA